MPHPARLAAAILVSLCPACDEAPPPDTAADVPPYYDEDTAIPVEGDAYADTDPSALTDFRGALDPHGQWIEDPSYGTVWQPNAAEVGPDFYPYVTGGHWAYDDDYVWVSDYEWGWAPFHYGRWVWIAGRGWAWVPGRAYAGAWVDWRYGEGEWGYVGWAPLAPWWIWRGGVAMGFATRPRPTYVYCPNGDVFAPVIATHVVPADRAAIIGGHTHVVAAPTVNAGNARFAVRGPAPSLLGVPGDRIAHPPSADRGLFMARAYARPSTAIPYGGHAAHAHVVYGAHAYGGGNYGGARYHGGGATFHTPPPVMMHGGGGHGRH